MLVGGMPESVKTWVEHHDYVRCQEVQDDIVVTYEDDFPIAPPDTAKCSSSGY